MSVEINDISKSFGTTKALDHINLSIPDGCLCALLGPSGSGKTTLLRIMAGLESADAGSGSISFFGHDVKNLPPAKRGIGFVFQHYALFPHMSVYDNIAFGLTTGSGNKPGKKEIGERVQELLDRVQLSGFGARRPHELSGGQRQRVALARALAPGPRLLLLDEPFGALDARVRKELRRWLRGFHDRSGLTTILVTHDQEEALELADSVVVMNHARVEQVGEPQHVFDNPASGFVYEFLGDVNKIGLPGAQPLYVRPHEVEVVFASDPLSLMETRVEHLFAAGPVARASLRVAGSDILIDAMLTRQQLEDMALAKGDRVGIRIHGNGSQSVPARPGAPAVGPREP
jgi:sulfate transport system ATP-binding protein